MICNSLDIEFIHGDVSGGSSRNRVFDTTSNVLSKSK